jgi:hypothetical protein
VSVGSRFDRRRGILTSTISKGFIEWLASEIEYNDKTTYINEIDKRIAHAETRLET